MNHKKELTIIVLTYNSEGIIEKCLRNLDFSRYKIVVVDNASTDLTVKKVKELFPETKLYELKQNIGFGNGNNVALRDVETDFALVLNPDALIDKENIELVLAEMKKNEKFALAGPVVLDEGSGDEEYSLKLKEITKDHNSIKDCYYEKVGDSYSVRFVIGCAMFFKMNVMRKIGFFDENIFLFYEDDEICHRVRKKGYHAIIVQNAKAHHFSGSSSSKNVRISYIRSWHMMWSKMYWKRIKKGFLRSKRSSFKFFVVYLIRMIFYCLLINKKEIVRSAAKMNAAITYFLGFGSFNKKKLS